MEQPIADLGAEARAWTSGVGRFVALCASMAGRLGHACVGDECNKVAQRFQLPYVGDDQANGTANRVLLNPRTGGAIRLGQELPIVRGTDAARSIGWCIRDDHRRGVIMPLAR